MSTSVSEHLEGLRAALVSFVRYADRAGLDARVPTTPDWTVRQLMAHQGMVHRWAAAVVRGAGMDAVDTHRLECEGRAATDPVEWLRDGALEVAQAISDAPDDLEALVFLENAPPARQFWARRQCHETTIHAVDALAAALGRYPKAADTWLSCELALDGIDELLTGFITRERSRLRCDEPRTILVRPTDSDRAWQVHVSSAPAVTDRVSSRRAPADPPGVQDILLEGSAVGLYLTLWNRSDEITPDDGWGLWSEGARVRWA